MFKLMSKVFKLNKIDTIDTFEETLRRRRGKGEIIALLTHLKIEFQKCSNWCQKCSNWTKLTLLTLLNRVAEMEGKRGNKRIVDIFENWTTKVFKLMSKVFKLNKIDTIDTSEETLRRRRGKEEIKALLTHMKIEFQKF